MDSSRRCRADRLLAPMLVLLAVATAAPITISQYFGGLAILAGLWRWRSGHAPSRTGLEFYAALMVGWALLTIPFSGDRLQSLIYARRFLLLAALWLFATAGRERVFRGAVLTALAISGAGLGLVGLVQLWLHGGAAYLAGSGQLVGRITLMHGYMTGGGVLMELGLVFVAFLVAPFSRRRWWLLAPVLLLVLAALLLTLTRSAWLGCAAGMLVALSLARPRLLPGFVLLVVLLGFALPGAYRARIVSAFDPAHPHNAQRMVMWRTGWQMMLEHPVTGVGDHDLKRLYRSYHPGESIEIHGHMHNNLVMFGAIWGVPGLVCSVLFLTAVPVLLGVRWRRLRRLGQRAPPLAAGWTLAGLAVWTGFAVAGLFEWNFGDAEVALLLWLVVGLGLADVDESPAKEVKVIGYSV